MEEGSDDNTRTDDEEISCIGTTEEEGINFDDIPEKFVCPLTLEIFTDPLMSRNGFNFERDAIIEWLDRGHETCPLTRDPLGYRGLVPNYRLRLELETWKEKNGYNNNNNNNNNTTTSITPRNKDVGTEKRRKRLCIIDVNQNPSPFHNNNMWYLGNQDNRQHIHSSSIASLS
jgi:hypothetical protein